MSTDTRFPLSRINMLLVGVLVVGAVVTAVLGNWLGTAFLGFIAVFVTFAARYARRADSRDITRINALEYRDERDRDLARRGFSAVGAAALILSMIAVTVCIVLADPMLILLSCGQLLVLCIVWAVSNSRVVATR
jgi:uncharacterized membrane protein